MLAHAGRRWRSTVAYSLIITLVMAAGIATANRTIEHAIMGAFIQQAQIQVQAAAQSPLWPLIWDEHERLHDFLSDWHRATGARVTLLDEGAIVLADSSGKSLETADLSALPEISPAAWESGNLVRRVDPVSGHESIFLVESLSFPGPAAGSLRFAFPVAEVEARIVALQRRVAAVGVLAALIILTLLVIQRERAMRTVRQLTDVADRITAGELDARILALNTGEMGQLTRAFNRMAGELESEIQKREREKDRLFTVMHVMADGVLILSRKGKVRMINPAAADLLNTNEHTAAGRSFIQVVRDHRIAEVWQRCRSSAEQQVAALDLGPHRFLRVIVTPFLRGADRGYVVILQDLTRLRQLQTVRQDFVSNVSHELRTPLASMRALADTLRDGALEDPPAARRFLNRMDVEVDSLTQLVEELLQLSRIESGRVPLRFRRVAVEDVIGVGADRLQPQAERHHLTLNVTMQPDLPNILVDPERVQQVITNLVHNAIKFTPDGGRIDVMAAPHTDDFVVVSVTDTGVGIPPEEMPRIFERFYKTDRARSTGGTGLGLAIAKHIVQSHGGSIWAESIIDQGSTFYLTLPAAPSKLDDTRPMTKLIAAEAL